MEVSVGGLTKPFAAAGFQGIQTVCQVDAGTVCGLYGHFGAASRPIADTSRSGVYKIAGMYLAVQFPASSYTLSPNNHSMRTVMTPSLNKRKGSVLSLVAFALFSVAGCSNTQREAAFPDGKIDAIFQEYTVDGSPGVAVMVISDGEIVHQKGYGLADLETRAPLTADTPVRLGSLSKAFYAMAIALLDERGVLEIDDLASTWVPEIRKYEGITIRHLLTHTSGIPEYWVGPEEDEFHELIVDSNGDSIITNPEAAAVYEVWGTPALAPPGDVFRYSNSAYELLALIIERVSHQSVRMFLKENIFDPLKMETADVRELPETAIPDRAIGYRWSSESESWVENDASIGNWILGAGGVYASLNDMYLWDQALYGNDHFSQELLAKVFTPATLNDGSPARADDASNRAYAFGWFVSTGSGPGYIGHGGQWVGFTTRIDRYPDARMSVILLSNASAPTRSLAAEVENLVLTQ